MLGGTVSKFLLQGLLMRRVPHFHIMPKLPKMANLDSPIVSRPVAACHSWCFTTCASIWSADALNECLHVHDYPTVVTKREKVIRSYKDLRLLRMHGSYLVLCPSTLRLNTKGA